MNKTTLAVRLSAAVASMFVTLGLFHSIALLGDPAPADRIGQTQLAKAAATAPKERL